MEKINRNVLETKASIRLADKIDEMVEWINDRETEWAAQVTEK